MEEQGQAAQDGDHGLDQGAIESAITARKEAKAARDFNEADRIRDQLRAQGIELIDKPGGSTDWIRERGINSTDSNSAIRH